MRSLSKNVYTLIIVLALPYKHEREGKVISQLLLNGFDRMMVYLIPKKLYFLFVGSTRRIEIDGREAKFGIGLM